MRRLVLLPSAWLGLPIVAACALTLLTYDLPDGYMAGLLLLAAAASMIVLIDVQAGIRIPPPARFRSRDYAGTRDAWVALAFAGLIVLFCLLDVTLFPVPLFDKPTTYAVMTGGREHVRHVSDMCWVLPVIGLLCARRRWLRFTLVAAGLLFPVLVIDRNRLFASVFAVALVVLLRRDAARPLPWKRVACLVLAGCGAFSALGMLRSGPLDYLTLPFSALFRAAPQAIKWILLYGSAGPYNFSAMLARHYANAEFLIHQLVPLSGSIATAGTGIPLDAPTVNVGTEFFPFLLALGPLGAVGSMFALYAMLLWSVRRVVLAPSLFPMLMFLRVAYVCVMSPFAPQAFTWTNAGFIGACLVMQVFAAWLPSRTALQALSDDAPAAAVARVTQPSFPRVSRP